MIFTIRCFVLMPFSPELTLAYEHGIRPTIEKLSQEYNIEVSIERADDMITTNRDKVDDIINKIKVSDLIIVDITNRNPNVFWELGYCTALGKNVVVIGQDITNLPFNIKTTHIYEYEFSADGLKKMTHQLPSMIEYVIDEIKLSRFSLRYEKETIGLIESLFEGLEQIETHSILKNLAKNELRRLIRRITGLNKGLFDLRNEKPLSEVIDYYSDYLSQLNGEKCRYDTITFEGFWKNITEFSREFRYLEENIDAANRGTKVRRLFLLDGQKYKNKIIPKEEEFHLILDRHLRAITDCFGNFEVKIFFSNHYKQDLYTYKNFAIWQKGIELILFEPEIDFDNYRMTQTNFYYSTTLKSKFLTNFNTISKRMQSFEKLWRKSEPLSSDNIE